MSTEAENIDNISGGKDLLASAASAASEASLIIKKASTIELPMIPLGDIIEFISQIHQKALENVPMPDVAVGMGYKHPSSTPFYRRCVAARLFGLMAKSGAELTMRGRDYLKPDGDAVRTNALKDALLGIQPYSEEINRNVGKRLNLQYIANSFAKNFAIDAGCANECARVFEASLKFAGFFTPDGLVTVPSATTQNAVPDTSLTPKPEQDETANDSDGMQTHTLYLDSTKTRKFSISAPLDVKPNEIKRIQKWLEVTLLMDWNDSQTV